MLGREQNPSPQLFLQIAEEKHRKTVTGINSNLSLKLQEKQQLKTHFIGTPIICAKVILS